MHLDVKGNLIYVIQKWRGSPAKYQPTQRMLSSTENDYVIILEESKNFKYQLWL